MYPKIFYSKIAGVSFNNPDGSSRQEIIKKYGKAGSDLVVMPDISNPVDRNALGLWINIGKNQLKQLGYISHDLSPEIRKEQAAGHRVAIEISEITGGTKSKTTYGVNIRVKII
jgi:hypothetical protein